MTTVLHPALRPANIHGVIKKKYQRPPIARQLFRDITEPTDAYTDILKEDYVGEIGEISGDAGFKFIKSKFKDVSGKIGGFGGAFKVNRVDEVMSRVSVASANMEDLVTAMKNYYEQKVLTAIGAISGHSTFDGSKWTDTAVGDPWLDFETAIGKNLEASGKNPDIAIMNRTTYLLLAGFKEYREFQYLGAQNIMQGGFINKVTPNGLKLVVFPDAIASTNIPTYSCIVTRSKLMGANHTVKGLPFETFDQKDPSNPLNTLFYAWEWAAGAIDERDAAVTCVITGLNT